MPVSARSHAREDIQLDLFAVRLPGRDNSAIADANQADGRAPPAGDLPALDRGTGGDGPGAGDAAGGGGPDATRGGFSTASLPPARILTSGPAAASAARVENSRIIEPLSPEPEPVRNPRNYRITEADQLGVGSLKKKCRANLAAIELLKQLEAGSRAPTEAERRVLVRYIGWGGLPQVFDGWNEEWKQERETLEALLTEDELDSARATTLNAHYTAPVVIGGMYALLEHLGFRHGRILEPALGLGHFIGLMPDAMHARSLITGIEIDSLTVRLARQLYPDADIRHQPFEEAQLADGFYDVALGNVPFSDCRPFDPRFKSWDFVLHDYFFAKSLDKVRPGGLILFITSRGTLDKQKGAHREYVASQADLLGAIRLPDDAFKKNAHTEVTTDIVVLRKRLPGELPSGPAWREIGVVTNFEGESIAVNEYFVAHPEMMLGEMRLEGRMSVECGLKANAKKLQKELAPAPPAPLAFFPEYEIWHGNRATAQPRNRGISAGVLSAHLRVPPANAGTSPICAGASPIYPRPISAHAAAAPAHAGVSPMHAGTVQMCAGIIPACPKVPKARYFSHFPSALPPKF